MIAARTAASSLATPLANEAMRLARASALAIYRLLTPDFTAPGSVAEPVLFTPAAVLAPDVLASPLGEGLLARVLFFVGLLDFIAPCEAPGPTLPALEAPSDGCAFCAKAAGEARASIQAEAKMSFFMGSVSLNYMLLAWSKRESFCSVPKKGALGTFGETRWWS
jgi:hypothetical protein